MTHSSANDVPDASQAASAWDEPVTSFNDPADADALLVDVAGFEGPLDLLLALARTQKVDLSQISVLALTEQYLAFISDARRLRLELAADYLVMAAWLAFLKSKLLLPRDMKSADEPNGEELAQKLAFRLQRLEAMRQASAALMARMRLGLDIFPRGRPEVIAIDRETQFGATVFDLVKAYGALRVRTIKPVHVVHRRQVWSIKDARRRLEALVGQRLGEWVQLDLFLDRYRPMPEAARTVLAASFGASLEMARDGLVELHQEKPFAPIFIKRRATASGREALSAVPETVPHLADGGELAP